MNPKILLDDVLIHRLKTLAKRERKITLKVLIYLLEVEDRRLYARSHSTLHEFCVEELRYSDGAASRRIESMRLMRSNPEVAEKIINGDLNISVLSLVQNFVKKEKRQGKVISAEQKKAFVEKFSGKSTRFVECELVRLSPQQGHKEKIRPLSETETSISFVADEELMVLLEEVKKLSGVPGETLASLFKKLARSYISKKTVLKKAPAPEQYSTSRFRTKATEITVRQRAGNRCEHIDARTGRRCTQTHGLHFDHIVPFAMGGMTTPENLQLLCATHNREKAVRDFGEEKMRKYFNGGVWANRDLNSGAGVFWK